MKTSRTAICAIWGAGSYESEIAPLVHHRVGRTDSLWRLESGGTEPTKITEFKTGRIGGTRWAPDAADVYFRRGTASQDVVMIRD